MQNWKEIARPARKAEYRNKYLRLLAVPPEQRLIGVPYGQSTLPVRIGDVVKIYMRRSAKETWAMCSTCDVASWGSVRVLEVEWHCPHCGHLHRFMIPEPWIDEGKAAFVEPAPADVCEDGHE